MYLLFDTVSRVKKQKKPAFDIRNPNIHWGYNQKADFIVELGL